MTTTELAVHLERLLEATPEVAFEAWTSAEARLAWFAPVGGVAVEATSDVRVGGRWTASFGPNRDTVFEEEGEYLEVDPPHRVVYTSVFRAPDGRSFTTRTTVTFEARGDKTLMVLHDTDYPDEQNRAAHEGGWPSFLDSYEQYLAG